MSGAMSYMAAIGALLSVVALVTERLFAQLGWPRRNVWLLSLIASLALPVGAMLTDDVSHPDERAASAQVAAPDVRATDADTSASSEATSADWSEELMAWAQQIKLPIGHDHASNVWPTWPKLDQPLTLLWVAGTSAMFLIYAIAGVSLRRAARHWPTAEIGGANVLVSERLGPAVFGLLRSRVVVPRWLLGAPEKVRTIAVRHELEHIGARDPVLIAAALLMVAIAPWNPALWWQLKRLRLAIEMDCDARLTRRGTDPLMYANVLFAVRKRHASTPFAAVALTEPKSQLERRILALTTSAYGMRPFALVLSCSLATALTVAACAIAPPEDGDGASPATLEAEARAARPASAAFHRQPITGLHLGGERIVFLVDVSGGMLGRSPAEIEQRRTRTPAEGRAAPKWRQLVAEFERLTEQVPVGSRFQVIAFDTAARSLLDGTDGTWVDATDDALARAVRTLRDELAPTGPSDLDAALTAARALEPAPDNVFLLTDGLPTVAAADAEPSERIRLFNEAVARTPLGAPVNVVLLPKEGEPVAAPAFWLLALRTGGGLFAPRQADQADTALASPADSDYVVFVIDTSGSMKRYAWEALQTHVAEVLAAHPNLLGFQFVTDEGAYLLESYRDTWIPNSADARSKVFDALPDWNSFSNSDPREGIVAAIEALYTPNKRIAIYVYGDDQGASSAAALRAPIEVLEAIERANSVATTGARKVRINAIALPAVFEMTGGDLLSAAGYAALMRELAWRNGGNFIALASL